MPSGFKLKAVCAALVATLALSSGCAGNIPAAPKDQRAASDPWEPLNRRIHNFNDGVDKVTLKPLAKGYQAVLPDFVERGVGNFSANLRGPSYIINNLLQGKVRRSLSETGRFLINSIVGIGGLFNVGQAVGMEPYQEDFGQTFAVWGVPDGPFVVVPLIGPRTLRDALAGPLNVLADPLLYVDDDKVRIPIAVVRAIDARARLFPAEALIADSFDRYISIREAYLQNREFRIYDGNPPEDDDFYEEFDDEEFLDEQ